MDERQSLYLAGAGFVATLATAAVAVGIAVSQDGGSALSWWLLAGSLVILALIIAILGVVQPLWLSSRDWAKTTKLLPVPNWKATHGSLPNGVLLFLEGPSTVPLHVVKCEVRTRWGVNSYVWEASYPIGRSAQLTLEFPRHFKDRSSAKPLFDHVPKRCYRQEWWTWDPSMKRHVFICLERFPLFSAADPGLRWRVRRCA